jgi:undecaprenyl-diphosphatase
LILTVLMLARLYLGLEWLSGALMGVLLGLAWTLVVGIAYRQRALQPFSGTVASAIFYGSVVFLFSWQVHENLAEDVIAVRTVATQQHMAADTWWASGWRDLPRERTSVSAVASRHFNAQIAVDPDRIAQILSRAGWERVPESDWRWVLKALNPDPNEASLPLLGRAFRGSPESLLMRRNSPQTGKLLTVRMWDSGVQLEPGQQVLYLAQISEEQLVQRLGLFSFWRSAPIDLDGLQPLREELSELEEKAAGDDLMLFRERGPNP